MSSLRHGAPVQMSGWVYKEGKFLRSKVRRFLKLRGSMLSNHHSDNSPASWEVSVLECPVCAGSRANELVIHLPGRKTSFFAANEREYSRWMEALKSAACRSVNDFYSIGESIGRGSFAEVSLGFDRDTGEKFAIKTIEKRGFSSREMELVKREMSIMKSVSHPCIVSTYDIFDTNTSIHIVLEYMEGGELFDVIANAGTFSEKKAQLVMRDILRGVAYLHMHSIVHRDIKPENILCKAKGWPLTVKIADLGLASFVNESGDLIERPGANMKGTAAYVAPEVVRREPHGAPVDVWACGVILFIMLSGRMPFYGDDDREVLEMIVRSDIALDGEEWSSVSDDAKSLVRSLLQRDVNKRLTAQAALNHRWLESNTEVNDEPLNKNYSGMMSLRRRFRRAVIAVILLRRMSQLLGTSAPISADDEVAKNAADEGVPQLADDMARLVAGVPLANSDDARFEDP